MSHQLVIPAFYFLGMNCLYLFIPKKRQFIFSAQTYSLLNLS